MGEPRLYLIFFEASLEPVPRELWEHPSVYKSAWRRGKKPGETLLDSSLHHQAIRARGLPEAEKRGRPETVHILLLEALSSPLTREGVMRVYVHTIGDYVMSVEPETRLPRNYNRFVGLMEQLFAEGRVPPDAEKPLITLEPGTVASILRRVSPRTTILYSWGSGGEKRRVRQLAEEVAAAMREGPVALLLPGFPRGEPRRETIASAERVYEPVARLEAWTLASHTLALIADTLGLV